MTYADLEAASSVVLVGFEPRGRVPDRVPATAEGVPQEPGTRVFAVSPVATRGLAKVGGTLIPTAPGTEPEVLLRPR